MMSNDDDNDESDQTNYRLQRKQQQQFMYSSFIAGLISGSVSSTICAPLDLVRTRLQVLGDLVVVAEAPLVGAASTTTTSDAAAAAAAATATTDNVTKRNNIRQQQKEAQHSDKRYSPGKVVGRPRHYRHIVLEQFQTIIRQDGWTGCFRGLTATLLTVPTFWGCYFCCYDALKWKFQEYFPQHNMTMIHIEAAITAGAIADVICNPMFVVRTRLQTESLHNYTNHPNNNSVPKQKSILETIRLLYNEGGIATFYRGMSANIIGLSHVAVQFPIYEQLKIWFRTNSNNYNSKEQKIQTREEGEESSIELLLSSGISKMSASLLTYPHEVVRSRMMDVRSSYTIGILPTCIRIYSLHGIYGFYAGLSISLIRVIPNTMLTFLLYERTSHYLKSQYIDEFP